MKYVSYIKIRYLYLILLILLVSEVVLFAQNKQIGGIINEYYQVTEINTSRSVRLNENDISGLSVGDTILLIQMKGGIMYSTNDANFGTLYDHYGTPGMHEFLMIGSISTSAPFEVTFTRDIKNNYDAERGVVQLIKVPYYNSANVTSTLTAKAWDGEKGGVLVFVVGSTLSLNANIDVTGKGFKGGESVAGNGNCAVFNDPITNALYYSNTTNEAGGKGEGIANYVLSGVNFFQIFPDYARGRGAGFTGGGGGNGRYGGGGGGAGWNTGGRGGNQGCDDPSFGLGGWSIIDIVNKFDNNNLFMGSGGGGSTYNNGEGNSYAGANGGGIIIIVCDTLKGNGKAIIADGGSPEGTAFGAAGAGGGGGGGSIALHVQNYVLRLDENLTLSAKGGQGGNVSYSGGIGGGSGGGGGGGLIVTNGATPSEVVKVVAGGAAGSAPINQAGLEGALGAKLESFIPALNGFLYNNIFSTVTRNRIDSICSNVPFGIIAGTIPLNGSTQWQSSTNGTTFTPISGATGDEYSPGTLSQTTWFRRVVTTTDGVIDASEPVRITVHSAIAGNAIGTIGDIDTVCYGQNPNTLISKSLLREGNGIYNYNWQLSLNGIDFTEPGNNAHTLDEYTPEPAITATTWYRRIVTSGRCVDVSDPVKISVLKIDNNIVSLISGVQDTAVCDGGNPNRLIGTAPTNSINNSGNYIYTWLSSTDNSTWNSAEGNGSNRDYNLPVVNQTTWYKRMVTLNVCTDISNSVSIKLPPDGPSSIINAGPDTVLYSFERYYQMKASQIYSYETGEWSVITGSGRFDSEQKIDARVTNLSPDKNTFQWTVTNGPCISKAIVNVTVKEIFIPNGFSPNNDGVNDYFEILGLDLVSQYAELSIVNSAGTEVFYTTNKNGRTWSNWDGKTSSGVDLAESTYYYKLTLESKRTDVAPYLMRGFIVLKRE